MERHSVTVRGIVQGVGFRPFVYSLAAELRLAGFVRNQSGGVQIEIEGEPAALQSFRQALADRPPPLARIDDVHWESMRCQGQRGFDIEPSNRQGHGDVFISPDVATCEDCLRELRDPLDRRYGYPFINCTNCGPRLTIIRAAPYDRARTTMAAFAMCPQCQAEYADPANRRFHAEPTCCPACGPRLLLLDADGDEQSVGDPLAAFVNAIRQGAIGALKGLGGFHLVCDATRATVVETLRRRKHRDAKPFAVMVADAEAARRWCHVNADELALLQSPRRPIVLLRRRKTQRATKESKLSSAIAPASPYLGLMLPYTPLHYLLLAAIGDRPLVMTSGNRADEPIAYDDSTVVDQLSGIADVFLLHDRPIHVRCDDSVVRVVNCRTSLVRRSRGYAPQSLALPLEAPHAAVAVGAQLKGTFALARGQAAFVSHHLGDLDHYEAYRAFVEDVELYEDLFEVRPRVLVHDLHPDYASTQYARSRARSEGLATIGVQHHHAHVASCMADNVLTGEVIGVAFDGTGLGTDGAIWGGEFLIAGYAGFRRAAHLRYVPLPGGDAAIREPWRVAVSHLLDAGCDLSLLDPSVDVFPLKTVVRMVRNGIRAPRTSSMGRLFDAVAAIIGLRSQTSFEGQAAMELEWLATAADRDEAYPFGLMAAHGSAAIRSEHAQYQIDVRPVVSGVVADLTRGAGSANIARRFHTTVCAMICEVCQRLRDDTGLNRVALTGGVFANAILASETPACLRSKGFEVFVHRQVPPNDGGISLGQLAVAAALLSDGHRPSNDKHVGGHAPPVHHSAT